MLRSFKTEINPSNVQVEKINKTIGTCRFVYNFYIAHNEAVYKSENRFISGSEFQKWLNNIFIPENPEYEWIKEVSSKSVKKSIMNAEMAFRRFFNNKSSYPKFKKKNKRDVKMYFVKNNTKDCMCERHRINIPTLGWVKIKEKGYIPVSRDGYTIKSGTVSREAGRYYVSVLIDILDNKDKMLNDFGVGIDLGLKNFIVASNGIVKENINKTESLKKIEKRLEKEQKRLSRKYQNNTKGGATCKNIQRQIERVRKIYRRIYNIRTDYINKAIDEIVKTKPSYISIEDLNIVGMMKNRRLSKAIGSQGFYEFRKKLESKCKECGIELRIVDKWYPSSKMCHRCGNIKSDLTLSDRKYICECGYIADRDFNASLNLRDALTYKVA